MDRTPMSEPPEPGWDAFLSYERAQEALAREVHRSLSEAGCRVFFDLDSLPAGARLDTALEAALLGAGAGVVVASHEWGRSGWATAEYDVLTRRREEEGLPLIVIVPPGAAPLELPEDTPWVVWDIDGGAAARVVATVRGGRTLRPARVPAHDRWERLREAAARGRDEEAAVLARELVADDGTGPERLDQVRHALAPLLRVSDDARCAALLSEAWALALALDVPRADLAYNRAVVLGRGEQPDEGEWLAVAEARADVEGDQEIAAKVAVQHALGDMRRGDPGACVARLAPLVQRWTPGEDPSSSMVVLLLLGSALRLLGEAREARERLEELRFRARASRDRTSESAAVFELGALIDDDDPDGALALYRESVVLSKDAGDRVGEVRGWAQEAVNLGRRGRGSAARRALDEARRLDPTSSLVAWAASWVERGELP